MSIEVHIDWQGKTLFVGRLYPAERGAPVSFEYAPDWLNHPGAFSIDPTGLPLQRAPFHAPALFGSLQDCGPDRWGRILIERAVRKKILQQRPFRDIDYVLALDDHSRIGALRFRQNERCNLFPVKNRSCGLFELISSDRTRPVIHQRIGVTAR